MFDIFKSKSIEYICKDHQHSTHYKMKHAWSEKETGINICV